MLTINILKTLINPGLELGLRFLKLL
jgi:hypothetical protein